MRKKELVKCLVSLSLILTMSVPIEAQKKTKKKRKRKRNPAFAVVEDDPHLPRVLLIGDSISIGYTAPVRKLLAKKANVHRIGTNGGPTIRGLKQIDQWLGKKKWDLIHFNWGLHDLKFLKEKRQVPLKKYRQNLEKLVARLKKTKAVLIWCNTTPVPQGVKPHRLNEDVLAYNRVAKEIMKKNKIRTNDLYSFANKRLSEIQRPKNVHFTQQGSRILAEKVSREILAALTR